MRIFLLMISIFIGKMIWAQPCSAPESNQFDFWIGEWDLTWSDTLKGENKIEKIFGNCTLQENFSDPQNGFFGKSWSVYNVNTKTWQQTWVDNNGGYIHLTGGMQKDSMILTTQEKSVPESVSPTGKIISRMVYYNIKPDSFDWSWESSVDSGKTWKPMWQIHYKRKN